MQGGPETVTGKGKRWKKRDVPKGGVEESEKLGTNTAGKGKRARREGTKTKGRNV